MSRIYTMIHTKTKDALRKSLIAECENKINAIIMGEYKNEPISFYTYDDNAKQESRDKVKRVIENKRREIKTLEQLMSDWALLSSKDVKNMIYDEFMEIELSYDDYKTTM